MPPPSPTRCAAPAVPLAASRVLPPTCNTSLGIESGAAFALEETYHAFMDYLSNRVYYLFALEETYHAADHGPDRPVNLVRLSLPHVGGGGDHLLIYVHTGLEDLAFLVRATVRLHCPNGT